MRTFAPPTPNRNASFPEVAIRNQIKEFWHEKTDEEAENPFAKPKNTLHAVLPVIDSLEIVKFMLQIEEVIGCEIPPKVIKRGGYHTCDEMIEHLIPKLRELYAKRAG